MHLVSSKLCVTTMLTVTVKSVFSNPSVLQNSPQVGLRWSVISLNGISYTDAGEYRCRAHNMAGSSEASISLDVVGVLAKKSSLKMPVQRPSSESPPTLLHGPSKSDSVPRRYLNTPKASRDKIKRDKMKRDKMSTRQIKWPHHSLLIWYQFSSMLQRSWKTTTFGNIPEKQLMPPQHCSASLLSLFIWMLWVNQYWFHLPHFKDDISNTDWHHNYVCLCIYVCLKVAHPLQYSQRNFMLLFRGQAAPILFVFSSGRPYSFHHPGQ